MKTDDKKNMVSKKSLESKYDNDLNRTKEINGYNAFEQNIFFLIASRFTQSDDTIITIPMDTVYDLSKGSYHNTHLVKMTQTLGKRIANLNFYKTVKLDDGKIGLRIGHLFTYIDITSDYIQCSLDPLFIDYFRHISNPFTVFDLEEFVNLKSKYSKTLYRCLLDLKNYGHPVAKGSSVYAWYVSLDDYRDILCFPKSYQVGRITMTTSSAVNELLNTARFKQIDVKSVYASHKRGRPLMGFEFRYTFKSIQEIRHIRENQPNDTEINPDNVKARLCPHCGRPVSEKDGKFGTFVGHAYKQGSCEKTWKSWEDFDKDCRQIKAKATGIGTGATSSVIPEDQMQYLEEKMNKDFLNAKSADKDSSFGNIKNMIAHWIGNTVDDNDE